MDNVRCCISSVKCIVFTQVCTPNVWCFYWILIRTNLRRWFPPPLRSYAKLSGGGADWGLQVVTGTTKILDLRISADKLASNNVDLGWRKVVASHHGNLEWQHCSSEDCSLLEAQWWWHLAQMHIEPWQTIREGGAQSTKQLVPSLNLCDTVRGQGIGICGISSTLDSPT